MVIEKDIRAHDFLRGGPKWRIILGSKGQPFLNPGYVWTTPYIMSTDVAIVENTFINTLSVTSRYARAINNGYYSTTTLL
jgi:hypothetical protein